MSYIKISTSASGARTVQLATKSLGQTVILEHFGSAHNEVELLKLKTLALEAKHRPAPGQADLFSSAVDLSRVRVVAHHPEYFETVIAYYYNLLGFTGLVSALSPALNSGDTLLFDLVMMRIYKPCSKLRSLRLLEDHFGRHYPFQAAYRLLGVIGKTEVEVEVKAETESDTGIGAQTDTDAQIKARANPSYKELLQLKLYETHKRYYGGSLSVVLYDVTTLYFESARDGDEYKLPGYSKDGKHNDPQILVGLLTNSSGFPLGYETFSGNTFEGGTLLIALEDWRKQLGAAKIRVVADAGMLSKLNVDKLTDAGFDFIVGARLKSVPASLTAQLLSIKNKDGSCVDGSVTEFSHAGHRLIVSYSALRERKDLHSIDKAIKKAEAIIDGKQSLKKRSKFVITDEPNKKEASLNQAAIDKDKQLAGLKGYITNLKKSEAGSGEVISQYKELINVEQSFRMSKHDLRARPVFHFKEESIKAHLMIVIMSLAVGRLLEWQTGQSIQKTVEQLNNALSYTLQDAVSGNTVVQHPETASLGLPKVLQKILGGLRG